MLIELYEINVIVPYLIVPLSHCAYPILRTLLAASVVLDILERHFTK